VKSVRGARLTLLGAIVGVLGLALFLYEALRVVSGDDILSSTGQLLMWVGFGITALGGFLLIAGGWTASGEPAATAPDED
jgi:hypothetical protein